MGDIADSREQRLASLRTWFHVSNPEARVEETDVQLFLEEVKDLHFMDDAAAPGRAASIIKAGYTSTHTVAGLCTEELFSLGSCEGCEIVVVEG